MISKGLINEAIINYNKALMIKPTSKTYNNLGVAFNINGQHMDAIKSFNGEINLEPKNAEAFYNMGLAYHKDHQHENSIKSYQGNPSMISNIKTLLKSF